MFVALLFGIPALLQDPSPAAGNPAEAEAVFRRAIEAQVVAGPRAPVTGFYVRLNLREREEAAREVLFEHLYTRAEGGLVVQRMTNPEGGVAVEKGFDGKRFWMLTAEAGGEPEFQDLSGKREFTEDRAAIDEAMEMSERLLLILDLDRLKEQARNLELRPGPKGPALSGRLALDGKAWTFRLELEAGTLKPLALGLIPPAGQAETAGADAAGRVWFVMRGHQDIEGRLIPRRIDVFHGERGAYPDQILEIRQLLWREPPPRSAFEAPDQRR